MYFFLFYTNANSYMCKLQSQINFKQTLKKNLKKIFCERTFLTSRFNISCHIATAPACSNDTLTNVLPNHNAMPQTQHIPPPPSASQYTDTRLAFYLGYLNLIAALIRSQLRKLYDVVTFII